MAKNGVKMFEAVLMGVMLTNEGQTVEKQWAAFVSMEDCQAVANGLTLHMKGKQGETVVFSCADLRKVKTKGQ
jgi:hypothetical protein